MVLVDEDEDEVEAPPPRVVNASDEDAEEEGGWRWVVAEADDAVNAANRCERWIVPGIEKPSDKTSDRPRSKDKSSSAWLIYNRGGMSETEGLGWVGLGWMSI
jgi:hypothetical protein